MKFNKKVLKNGLTVLHEKRDVPVTTVMLAAKYGFAYEEENERGIAHFLEHLCFKGTKRRTALQISSEIESLGGIFNAFTAEEVTAYYTKLPSIHLEKAMDVIFDIFFNPTLPQEEIDKEGKVILEELKMRRDNPTVHIFDLLKETLYHAPFGISSSVESENVKKIKREDIMKRHSQTYVPKNSILCIVGNNDFEDVLKLAEKFSVEKTGEKIEISEIKTRMLKKHDKRASLEQTSLAFGFHTNFEDKKMAYALDVFSAILGGGMSSKLFTEVREKRGLVYTVHSYNITGKNYGYFIIYSGTDKSKVEEVEKICMQEYKKMKDITKKKLESAKVQVIGNFDVKSEDSEEVAVHLILEETKEKAEDYYNYAKNINDVNLKDIKKLASNIEFSRAILGP